MIHSRPAALVAAIACAVLVGVGLAQLAGRHANEEAIQRLTAAQMSARLAGSPAPLAALHAQGSRLLGGGMAALRRRLAALHGYPVVLNKWASWCSSCRAEFGALQRASVDFGRQVAFIGVDSGETLPGSATAFLRSFPVSYPSYSDPTGRLGEQLTYSTFTPVTVFIAPSGRRYIHQGPYATTAKLERDVRRYALNA